MLARQHVAFAQFAAQHMQAAAACHSYTLAQANAQNIELHPWRQPLKLLERFPQHRSRPEMHALKDGTACDEAWDTESCNESCHESCDKS